MLGNVSFLIYSFLTFLTYELFINEWKLIIIGLLYHIQLSICVVEALMWLIDNCSINDCSSHKNCAILLTIVLPIIPTYNAIYIHSLYIYFGRD